MSDVCICLFAANGFDKGAQGLAGAGRRLADELGGQLRAVVLGAEAERLASGLAHLLGGSAVGDGVGLKAEADSLSVQRQVYGGKAQAVIELKRRPAVVWLR